MFLFRKNIILVPSDYDGISISKGLLSFDAYSGKTICNLHCYNLDADKPLLLGIAINKRLFKVKIDKNQQKSTNFDLDIEIKNDDSISCVLLDVGEKDYSIVLWGSTKINDSWKSMLELMLEDQNLKQKTEVDQRKNVETQSKVYDQKEQSMFAQKFQNQFDDEPDFDNQNSQNKENFQENQQDFAQNQQILEQKQLDDYIDHVIELSDQEEDSSDDFDKKQDNFDEQIDADHKMPNHATFFDRISPQVKKMFADNSEEKILTEILPNSKFCRVDFDDRDGYYVFGLIYDAGMPKYLCYGLPAKKGSKPPLHLSKYYQWLPIDVQNQNSDGFYMMYQDAETGKNISVEVIWIWNCNNSNWQIIWKNGKKIVFLPFFMLIFGISSLSSFLFFMQLRYFLTFFIVQKSQIKNFINFKKIIFWLVSFDYIWL